jgi:hypothetical protein
LTAVGGEGALETVTVTGAEVVRLPAASRATAVRVYEPLLAVVVSTEIEYGAVVSSAAKSAPLTLNWTPATPLSSDAVALMLIVPETVAPEAGDVMLTVGGMVSGLGHVISGRHGNWAKAWSGMQARLKIASRAAAQKFALTFFSMDDLLERTLRNPARLWPSIIESPRSAAGRLNYDPLSAA